MMPLSALTNESLIVLNADFTHKEEILRHLCERLYQQGAVTSVAEFLRAIHEREALSETGLEQGLAIPHGKADCVKQAMFAIMTTQAPIDDWESLDPDNRVQRIIMLAIPAREAGSTHLDLLAQLMGKMTDQSYTDQLFCATTPHELYQRLDVTPDTITPDITYHKTIVAVTACPAGIAHTYMAAKALEQAGDKLGVQVYVEKQGANGVEDRLTNDQLSHADAAIFAVEVAVKEPERFAHLSITKVSVAQPIKDGVAVIKQALDKANGQQKGTFTATEPPQDSLIHTIKQSVLTGISYMIPIVVAGGLIGAFAVMVTNIFGLQTLYDTADSWPWLFRQLASGLLGTLLVPVLSAYMAYSIGDKTALASGFAAGLAANLIGGGFLVGMLGGLLAGFTTRLMKRYLPAKGTFAGFVSFLVYPVLSTLIVTALIFLVIGQPVAWLNNLMIQALGALSGTNAALLGALIGIMVSFDLGGPINKAAYAFCVGAMAEGVLVPYAVFASVKMVSGFGITLATLLARQKFSKEEQEAGKTTWLLVLGGITEGAIPFMMADPLRVILSLCTGSALTGALVAMAGVQLDVPGAGIFSMFMLKGTDPLWGAVVWLGAAILGGIVSAILLVMLRHRKLSTHHTA